jgi:hypothetical protein
LFKDLIMKITEFLILTSTMLQLSRSISSLRKSTEGYLIQLFGGAIDWHSAKQKTVTTSGTEAELLALTHSEPGADESDKAE